MFMVCCPKYGDQLSGLSSQNRQPVQVLDEARDAIQTLYVGHGIIMAGSVDEHVRTYDLRMGQLREDYIGCASSRAESCCLA